VIVSINQPCYLPWCGLFERIARADVHVHLDDVQYSRSTYFAKNRVVDRTGREGMLVVPVQADVEHTFLEARVPETGWRRKHVETLKQIYGRMEAGAAYLGELAELYKTPYENVAELNVTLTEWMLRKMEIGTRTVRSSTLGVTGASTSRLIAICRQLGATQYYSPAGAREYLDASAFENAGIALVFQTYAPVPYDQGLPTFVPYLSAVDPLFRFGGKRAKEIVVSGGG
jgi:hypothetical protein